MVCSFVLIQERASLVRYYILKLRACLHEGGGPQVGEVTCGRSPHISCKHDQIRLDYMDRRATPVSGLPHLPGVPHLHVNKPLESGKKNSLW